jgi:ATP-dependent Clp protease ATP-binding subunit ClpC
MEVWPYPMVCWPLPGEQVLGQLVGFGWELVASDADKLRTAFVKELQRELYARRLAKPPLEGAALKICRVEVRPGYKEEDGTYPAPAPVTIPVAAVCGENPFGSYSCFLPSFGGQFYYYKPGQVEALVEHFVRDEVRGMRPEQVHRFLMADEPWLDTVALKVKDEDEGGETARHEAPDLPTVSSVSERIPYTKAVRQRISLFPAAAWERSGQVHAVIAKLMHEKVNILLVGDRGVGKSAIIREAARVIHGVADASKRPYFWRTSPRRMVSGAKWLGDWQEIIERIVAELRESGDILWVEEIVELLGVGGEAAEDSVAGFLAPHLDREGIRMVGEMTPRELDAVRTRLPGFAERFHVLRIDELGPPEMVKVLDQVADAARKNANVTVERRALEVAYRLLQRYARSERFPGKAIKFLADCVNDAWLEKRKAVAEADVLKAFTLKTGLPEIFLRDDLPLRAGDLEAFFRRRILGQDEALEKVLRAVKVFKAGLNDPAKPVATLLLAGPTGVGKTATARALAAYCFGARDGENALLRLDMSEFQSQAQMARLIGSPWGEPGPLIQRLRERPFSVLLLDEIEKAHPVFFDVLLTVLDEGVLADAFGRVTEFRNTIVVMTTNLGARRGSSLGFGSEPPLRYDAAIRDHFRPEFVNRLDQIIEFRPLSAEAIEGIARKELAEVAGREGFLRRGLKVEFSEALVRFVASVGFDPVYGARPLQRAIERHVVGPLSRRLLKGEPPKGATLCIDLSSAGECVISVV